MSKTKSSTHKICEEYARSNHTWPTETCTAFQNEKPHLIHSSSRGAWLGYRWMEEKNPNSGVGTPGSDKEWVPIKDSYGNTTSHWLFHGNVWFRCTHEDGCGKWHSGRAGKQSQWQYGRTDIPFWKVKAPAMTKHYGQVVKAHLPNLPGLKLGFGKA